MSHPALAPYAPPDLPMLAANLAKTMRELPLEQSAAYAEKTIGAIVDQHEQATQRARIVNASEAGRLTDRCTVTLREWRRLGLLPELCMPNSTRPGYRVDDILNVIKTGTYPVSGRRKYRTKNKLAL